MTLTIHNSIYGKLRRTKPHEASGKDSLLLVTKQRKTRIVPSNDPISVYVSQPPLCL